MNFLDKYPDVMTVKEVAEHLRINPCTVYAIKGLKRIRMGVGKGFIRILKSDLIAYIKSCSVVLEDNDHDSIKAKRHRKMGIPGLLPLQELQAIHLQNEGRGALCRI